MEEQKGRLVANGNTESGHFYDDALPLATLLARGLFRTIRVCFRIFDLSTPSLESIRSIAGHAR